MKASFQNIGAGLLVILLALGIFATAYAVQDFPEEKFVKRVSFAQVDLSSFSSFQEVSNHLQEQKEAFLDSQVTWTSDQGEITLSMREMGVTPDAEGIHEFLNHFMEESSPWERVQSYVRGLTLAYPMQVNQDMLKLAFADSGIEQGMKNATYRYENGSIQVDPEQVGYGVDQEALTKQIQNYWEEGFVLPSSAELPLRVGKPEWTRENLLAFLAEATEASQLLFNISDEEGNTWRLPLNENMHWIYPDKNGGLNLQNESVLADLSAEILIHVEQEPQSVVITETEEGIHFEGSARFGKDVDEALLLESMEEHLDAKSEDPILLAVQTTQPEISVPDTLKARGITDLIGMGESNFAGSPTNRIYNVNFGANLFNGIIVPQGEEFSFVENMGVVDEAHGWRSELVIKGDETIPEAGGGICQISTTAFRAALFTGLPITDRRNHSYAVSYYGQDLGYGLDSTVYQNAPDSKWINDTAGDLLMQVYTEGTKLYFVFYGTPTGRKVLMEGPTLYNYKSPPPAVTIYTDKLAPGERVLESYGHTGFEADWYRTIIFPDGTQSERENFHSSYRAMPAKYLEGHPAGSELTNPNATEVPEFVD